MLHTNRPDADVEALRARLEGAVYGPSDAGWDRARAAWNLAVDQRPAAVAVPVHDGASGATAAFSRGAGARICPPGRGHRAAALARTLERGILPTTAPMPGASI